MWAERYFCDPYFAPRYWAKAGEDVEPPEESDHVKWRRVGPGGKIDRIRYPHWPQQVGKETQ